MDSHYSSEQPRDETAGTDSAVGARSIWDSHWLSLGNKDSRSLFGLLSSSVRRIILRPAVRFFLDKYFPCEGAFVEAGCGTGESSAGVPRRNRRFVGVDFSTVALAQAKSTRCFNSVVCADLFNLPLRSGSVDGIWNLGVMEHFERAALIESLGEFRRVLKSGGMLVIFWPAEGNLSRWALAPMELVCSAIRGRPFRFFPDEVSRLRSRKEAGEILSEAGLKLLDVDFSMRTVFIHMVVIGTRP